MRAAQPLFIAGRHAGSMRDDQPQTCREAGVAGGWRDGTGCDVARRALDMHALTVLALFELELEPGVLGGHAVLGRVVAVLNRRHCRLRALVVIHLEARP